MSRWGDEKTLLFIRYYKQHECLWNSSSPLYKNKIARENAYMSLLEQFNDDKLTVKLMRQKIKNLRTTYHQELNKIRDSVQSAAAASLVYKPSVCWFEEMDSFLSESLQNRPTSSTKIITENLKRKLNSSSDSDIQASGQNSTVNHSEYHEMAQPANINQEPAARKLPRLVNNKKSHSMTQHDEMNLELSDNDNRLNNISTTMNTPRACEDEFHFFGMNIAAQLRALPLPVALKLQTDFQNTLYLTRVRGLHSSPGADDIMSPQSNEQLNNSETIVHNVDEKGFPLHIQQTIALPFDNQLPIMKME